jgi:transcriptional regulator with XRE-family HTH domain
METTIKWLLPMEFVKRLIELRKQRGLTQQALADGIELHVNQIKRYEAGTAQPTLETLVRLARELHTTLDDLVFGEDHRSPDDDLRLQFEALTQFDEHERIVVKELLESLILKHNAKRAFAGKLA